MISNLYLKRALDIRKDYLEIRADIDKYEKIAEDLILSLDKNKEKFTELLEELNTKKLTNPEKAKKKLEDIVLATESDMNGVESSVNSLNEKIDKLREDEQNLYKEIKRSYTDLTDDQIKQEVQNYLKRNLSE